jgi:hypothetical protein
VIVGGLGAVSPGSLDAMITSKRAMGRARDLDAVLELEAIREQRNKQG